MKTRQQKRQAATVDLRREAAYRDCQIRVAPNCAEGTVLCHWRQLGISGLGIKTPDALAAWGCSACHALVDAADENDHALRLDFAKAIFRTQAILIREGKIQW